LIDYCGCCFQLTTPGPSKTPAVKVPGALVKVPSDDIYIFIIRFEEKEPDNGNITGELWVVPLLSMFVTLNRIMLYWLSFLYWERLVAVNKGV